jgi:cyclopropane-fatty-acyl-phospholipid synthase
MIDNFFLNRVNRQLGKIEFGQLRLTLPNKKEVVFEGSKDPTVITADLTVKKWIVFVNLILQGDVAFGDDYIKDKWYSSNLFNLFCLVIKNQKVFKLLINGNRLALIEKLLKHWKRRNTISRAKENIQAHYDLGNSFYQAWLDKSLTYSSALFKKNNGDKLTDLYEAQQHKISRIVHLLKNLQPNALVCEIGLGWGSVAEKIINDTSWRYEGLTLSERQFSFVNEKFKTVKNNNRLNFEIKDYRLMNGKYDAIISIEMFEAVGQEYWNVFFEKVSTCLKDGSKLVIQTILIKDEKFEHYKKNVDFIQTFIFPGGMLPSKKIFRALAASHNLKIQDELFFGADYAETLRLWATNFNKCAKRLERLDISSDFKRMWTFYLNYCRSGFATGELDVGQFLLVK